VHFVPPNINGFTMQKWDGSTPPRWKMEAFGYGTKRTDGDGPKQAFIPTCSVGEIRPGFISMDE